MALPDAFERVGIVVGCTLLLSLPTSALASLLLGPGAHPPYLVYLLPVPGFAVGLLVATERLSFDYHAVWQFAIASWLVAAVGAALLGLYQSSRPALGVSWWLVSVVTGLLVARVRVRESLAAALD